MSTPQRPHRNRARVRRDGALERVSQATRVVVIAAVSGAVGVGVYISRAIPGISAVRAPTSTGTTGTSGTGAVPPATSSPTAGSTGGGVSAGSVGGSSSGGSVGGGSVGGGSVGSASSAGNSYSGGSVGYVPAYQAPVASSGAS